MNCEYFYLVYVCCPLMRNLTHTFSYPKLSEVLLQCFLCYPVNPNRKFTKTKSAPVWFCLMLNDSRPGIVLFMSHGWWDDLIIVLKARGLQIVKLGLKFIWKQYNAMKTTRWQFIQVVVIVYSRYINTSHQHNILRHSHDRELTQNDTISELSETIASETACIDHQLRSWSVQ